VPVALSLGHWFVRQREEDNNSYDGGKRAIISCNREREREFHLEENISNWSDVFNAPSVTISNWLINNLESKRNN